MSKLYPRRLRQTTFTVAVATVSELEKEKSNTASRISQNILIHNVSTFTLPVLPPQVIQHIIKHLSHRIKSGLTLLPKVNKGRGANSDMGLAFKHLIIKIQYMPRKKQSDIAGWPPASLPEPHRFRHFLGDLFYASWLMKSSEETISGGRTNQILCLKLLQGTFFFLCFWFRQKMTRARQKAPRRTISSFLPSSSAVCCEEQFLILMTDRHQEQL